MKRDLEMVRDILMEIENLPRGQTLKVIDQIPEERRNYWDSIRGGLLTRKISNAAIQCDFITPVYCGRVDLFGSGDITARERSRQATIDELELYRLTTEGYDFLDSIRDENRFGVGRRLN